MSQINNINMKRMFYTIGDKNKLMEETKDIDHSLLGISNLDNRLSTAGGNAQQKRMIAEKKKSFIQASNFSYQSALVKKDGAEDTFQGLMNPNKVKPDYDEKILSVGYESGFQCGETFEWIETKSHWLIYLQDLTELAYFRGNVRRCSYKISWKYQDKNYNTFIALRGPVETRLKSILNHKISTDEPNYSLHILMPKNENTVSYFKRYSKFYLNNSKVCWRVEAADEFSTPGILELNAIEYYSNEFQDDVDNGIANGLIVEEDNGNESLDKKISGPLNIKPKLKYTYFYSGESGSIHWTIKEKGLPVKISNINNSSISLQWNALYSGKFTLQCNNSEALVKVSSI